MIIKQKKRALFAIFVLSVFMLTAVFHPVQADEPEREAPELDEEIIEHATMENFEMIMDIVEDYYVDEISEEDLLKGAIEGMLREVDIYSSFMTEEEYLEMQEEMEGEYGGIGIIITMRENELTVVSPISGTPADGAGVQAEDIITAVDGESTENMDQQRAVDKMRGDPGTEVTITIYRNGEEFDIDLTREQIDIPIIEEEKYLNDRIGYISISQFLQETGSKLARSVQDMEADGAEALIIDLRNNPGGILQESITVSSVFADEGTVLSMRQREGRDQVFNVNPDMITTDLPVLVLTNRGSASASEIVAGFIQDNDRGVVLGDTTFGKGTVQSVFPLEDGSALRLTTARYYTSGENMIDEEGIKPDYEVVYEDDPLTEEDLQLDKAVKAVEYYLEEGNWPESEKIIPDEEAVEEIQE